MKRERKATRKPWTMKDLQFLEDNHNFMSHKELADKLDRTGASGAVQKNKRGLKSSKSKKIYEVVRGYEVLATGTAEECAEQPGLSVSTIRFYTSPAHKRRSADLDKAILVYRVD